MNVCWYCSLFSKLRYSTRRVLTVFVDMKETLIGKLMQVIFVQTCDSCVGFHAAAVSQCDHLPVIEQ